MSEKTIRNWVYNSNINYKKYYGSECIVSVNYGLYDTWRTEKYLHRGILSRISEPTGRAQESTIILNERPTKYSIASTLIDYIYIDNSKESENNLKIIKSILIFKTNYDIYDNIEKFLLPDLIEI